MNNQKFSRKFKISISKVKLDYLVLFSYMKFQLATFLVYCKLPSFKLLKEKTNSRK